MQPRQHRLVARGLADLDGVVLLPAVLGAEDVDAPRLRHLQRHAARDDGLNGAGIGQNVDGRRGIHTGQPVRGGETLGVVDLKHQNGRQDSRRLDQLECEPVQIGRPLPRGLERPLHRLAQIVGRVRDGRDPGRRGIGRQHDPGEVAVIWPRLERLRPTRRDRQNRLPLHLHQGTHAVGGHGFGCEDQRAGVAPPQHDAQPHAQIGTRAGQRFGDVGGQAHLRSSLVQALACKRFPRNLKHSPARGHVRVKEMQQSLPRT